jgi:putative heme-binding domain-containing protein
MLMRPATRYLCILSVALSTPWAIAQRELKDIPIPDPQQERATFQVDEGWNVELFAGDPSMAKPIHMNWDHRGRLWIASSETYPQIKPGEPSNDKILILEDGDRDGRSDRTVVFADGLLIPTGVLPANDGDFASAYVVNSDQLLYLKDTDGDLVADERSVVLTGFGTEDTHHLLHSLRWGHDGWIYMNQSIYIHSHIETPWGVQRLNGGGIWRYHPESKRLEVVVRGFVNPWGVHFDRFGQMFATDGAYGEGINYAFPGSVFVTAVGAKRLVAGLNPGSPKHCGLEILSGAHWPDSIRGTMVTNDFRAHRVCRFRVTEDQSGYESVQLPELIKTPHVAFRPIDAKQGLDGALYIADWYNPIIQHGEVDFRDPRRDRTHGRIWRLTHRDQLPVASASISAEDSVAKNLERLGDDADLVRLFASQSLRRQWRSNAAHRTQIDSYAADLIQQPQRGLEQLELLWMYEGLGVFHKPLQLSVLGHSDGRIRAAAVHQIANEIRWIRSEQLGEIDSSQLAQWIAAGKRFVQDPHPRVRLEAVRMLAEIPQSEAAYAACQVLRLPMDRFLDFALWQTIRDLQRVWLPEFRSGTFRFGDQPSAIAFALKAAEDPSTIDAVLGMIDSSNAGDDDNAISTRWELAQLISELGSAAQHAQLVQRVLAKNGPLDRLTEEQRGNLLRNTSDVSYRRKEKIPLEEGSVHELLEAASAAAAAATVEADFDSSSFGVAAMHALGRWQIVPARSKMESWASDRSKNTLWRQAAIRAIGSFADDNAQNTLRQWSLDENASVAATALAALLDLDLENASKVLLDRLSADPERTQPLVAIAPLWLSRRDGASSLARNLADRSIHPSVARQLKSELRKLNAPGDLLAAIDSAGKLQENRWQLSKELQDRWLTSAEAEGNAVQGERIYRRPELQCIQCHRIGGVGGAVGPDLTSIGAQAPADYLLESLLNPAAKVKEGYNAKLIRTEDDEVLAGIPIRESDNQVVLRLADNREVTIDKSNVVEIKESRSLMPDGLLDSLTEREAIDLLRFITELGKLDGTMRVQEDGAIRAWESLSWSDAAFTLFNRTSFDAITGDQSRFTWQLLPALVSGSIPLQGLAKYRPHPGVPDHTFLRTKVACTRAGQVSLDVSDLPKGAVSLWMNGKPIPVDGNQVVFDISEGEHLWFVGVNRDIAGDGEIRIRVNPDATSARLVP